MRRTAQQTVRTGAFLALLLGCVGQAIAQLQPQDPGPPAPRPSTPLIAGEILLPASDSGWYNQAGLHNPLNTNYMAGFNAGAEVRDFFVFDLSNLGLGLNMGQVLSGQLTLFNPASPPGYSSPNANETYTLFDVSTPIPSLVAGGTGLTPIFNDLGTGTNFGS